MINLAWGIDSEIEIDGLIFLLDLEFSTVLRWFEVIEDQEESEEFKVLSCLMTIGNLSESDMAEIDPEIIQRLFVEIVHRLIPQTEREQSAVKKDLSGNVLEEPESKSYDLFEDGNYIFASFMQQYAIDLTESNLHWDKFNAMLDGLSENTRFREVIKIRQMKIPEKATQEERDAILKAKESVALRSNREAMEFEAMDLRQKREWYARQNKN